jgi:hypothetical protein
VDSAALVDPDTLAGWTEAWGHWLASLPHEAQVQAATVTIESFPDTGQHLIAETARLSRPGAPDLAGAFLDEVWAGSNPWSMTRGWRTSSATAPTRWC